VVAVGDFSLKESWGKLGLLQSKVAVFEKQMVTWEDLRTIWEQQFPLLFRNNDVVFRTIHALGLLLDSDLNLLKMFRMIKRVQFHIESAIGAEGMQAPFLPEALRIAIYLEFCELFLLFQPKFREDD